MTQVTLPGFKEPDFELLLNETGAVEESEAEDEAILSRWRSVFRKGFLAMQFIDKTRNLQVVSKSFEPDQTYRVTMFELAADGRVFPVWHTDYGSSKHLTLGDMCYDLALSVQGTVLADVLYEEGR